ncbi:MAG: zinc-dependent peptidase [Chitinophagales bacterium]|nr:zinc-dependent peptidase [Bacteroidota bacterium]MCB9043878.1 zinc-dependent peptidase [Chitinophagales bacterium]
MLHLLDENEKIILKNYFLYYNLLDDTHKIIFEHRLAQFKHIKHFRFRDVGESLEVKILVSAIAIQLTMGLDFYLYPNFHTIVIHGNMFYATSTGHVHQQEVRNDGIVVLNWHNTLEALKYPKMVYSHCIHAWATALLYENSLFSQDFLGFAPRDLLRWKNLAKGRIKQDKLYFPSENEAYLEASLLYLFTACTEAFYQDPWGLRQQSPDIYRAMAIMYKQDILGIVPIRKN